MTCPTGKHQHRTAIGAARELHGRGTVYRCPHCHQWHVSSMTGLNESRKPNPYKRPHVRWELQA